MNEYIKNRTLLSALITSLENNLPLSKQEEKDIRRYLEDYQKALNEIERLTNIINELEKRLNKHCDEAYEIGDISRGDSYAICLDELQELKGSDK